MLVRLARALLPPMPATRAPAMFPYRFELPFLVLTASVSLTLRSEGGYQVGVINMAMDLEAEASLTLLVSPFIAILAMVIGCAIMDNGTDDYRPLYIAGRMGALGGPIAAVCCILVTSSLTLDPTELVEPIEYIRFQRQLKKVRSFWGFVTPYVISIISGPIGSGILRAVHLAHTIPPIAAVRAGAVGGIFATPIYYLFGYILVFLCIPCCKEEDISEVMFSHSLSPFDLRLSATSTSIKARGDLQKKFQDGHHRGGDFHEHANPRIFFCLGSYLFGLYPQLETNRCRIERKDVNDKLRKLMENKNGMAFRYIFNVGLFTISAPSPRTVAFFVSSRTHLSPE
ncbi:hypothetical protein O181_005981 [Austropuccinia psidii MF-1]|uniref:Uncharacterized protein n=1 Tax=Austropuccinia psidii MF-1 TaxID=1389203 RepID=A0A9Q3BJX9_9BASI|nr:hypothetical protein [Austropuccinia psidii MF-1]